MKIIKSRIFKVLVFLFVLGFVLGILTYFMIDNKIIDENMYNYIDLIKKGNFTYLSGLFKSIISNNKYLFFIWISGILLVSIFIIPFIIMFRGISLGLVFISLIITFNIKGILYFLLLFVPTILLNELIYIFCSYYSLNFSMKIYNSIKSEKLINIKKFFKNYFYIYIIFSSIILISSLFEIYISSNIIKFVV